MRLSLSQISQLLQQPLNADQIAKAKRLEERVKLHVEAMVDTTEMQARFQEFRQFVSNILPPDKMEGFCALWQAPVETNELTEAIFGELSRVFQAENPYTRFSFRDTETARDFEQYLATLGDEKFWKVDYWNELKGDQNSIVVVDLPAIQASKKPEPYYYLLDINHVLDMVVTKKGCLEYLIAETSEPGIILVLDDEFYRTYTVPNVDGKWDFTKAVLTMEVAHKLGRVPAKPMYFQPINKRERIVNHNPITRSLGALDWLLFYEVAKKFLETYAPYPIYATYTELDDSDSMKQNKGEENLNEGLQLNAGVTIAPTNDNKNRNANNRKLIGPGTVQRYDAPVGKEDSDLLQNPVQVIPAETESLNYVTAEVDRRNAEIFKNCVGDGGEAPNDQAVNEKQVTSMFESKKNILGQIRGRIEECRQYVYGICAQLRYGDLFESVDVSMGNEYYLRTVADQQEELKGAIAAGLPDYEVQNQISAIFRNKYRDQPETLQRNEILAQLEPYPGYTVQQVADLIGKGYGNAEKLKVKMEFDALIKRFEREQMNIVDFASARPIQTKIDIIWQKLLDYVRTENPSEQKPGQGTPDPGIAK